MSSFAYNTLKSSYLSDPVSFMEILNGDTEMSAVYKDLIAQIVQSAQSALNFVNRKIVKLDFDGNVLYSDDSPYFGQTKKDVKTINSKVYQFGPEEIFIADALRKKAVILEITGKNASNAVLEMFIDEPSEDDITFINAVFSNMAMSVPVSKVSWTYSSTKYVTGFYPISVETKEIQIDDDAIRNSNIYIRQGTTVKWLNNSCKPISIYSGKTDYDSFILDPNLNLYGYSFKSPVLQPGETWSYKFVSVEEYDWFVYPDILTGTISITKERLNADDQFLIVENDNLNAPFSSRIIKVDSWGNILWSFGEAYLIKPRNARSLINDSVIIST